MGSGPKFGDEAVFEITEGGAEALSFVEGVFVDTEGEGALKRDAFGGFAPGEPLVDALDGGFSPGDGAGADFLMVLLEDGLAEGAEVCLPLMMPGKSEMGERLQARHRNLRDLMRSQVGS